MQYKADCTRDFCQAFFKKALIELRQRSSETAGNPPSGCASAVKICKRANKGLIQTVDAACDKVGFCDEYGAGVYYVLDCSGAGARRKIVHDAPPQ